MAKTLEETMRDGMVLAMVQRQIFCPQTGHVLDVRTCTVILDKDDDPVAVYSPVVGQAILDTPELRESLAAKGLRVREA